MRAFRLHFLTCLLPLLLVACGGGGGSGAGGGAPASGATPPPAPLPSVSLPSVTAVTLQSDAGDYIGQGRSYRYSGADATLSFEAKANRLVVRVEGDEQWTGVFQTGGNAGELKAGEYRSLDLYTEGMDASKGGLTWWGNGRSCRTSTGWVVIDSVSYSNGVLAAISLRFQRNCNGATAALRGEIQYSVNDKTLPTPIGSPPADLWRAPAAVTAGQGTFAYFESEEGDHVGLGKTYRYDPRSARVHVDGGGANLSVTVAGEDIWKAELRGPNSKDRLIPGYYPGIRGARFSNPHKGGMSWTAAGRGCSASTGWFVVDAVEYNGYQLIGLDLRFEQHCEGRAAALRGALRYRQAPATAPAGVLSAAGSWRAPAALLPASGNVLYMESDSPTSVSNGVTDLQTSSNAAITVSAEANRVEIVGDGNRRWLVQFHAPSRFTQIVPGVYEGLVPFSADSGPQGTLLAAVDSSGCFADKAWVAVDSAEYSAGKLVGLELRFEHACGSAGALLGVQRGQLRWRAGAANAFPGPAAVPATFWRPTATLPAGTYIYTTSDRSDFIGSGELLQTPLDAEIALTEKDGKVAMTVHGDAAWSLNFQAMETSGKILPGYYAGLGRFQRPARGGFNWSGDGRGCNESGSGVVVDKVVYAGDKLIELALRFEQHCENEPGATRGQLHWLASDTRQPPGPRQQVPDTLWRAPAGALPEKGNFLYVESGAGDFIGNGRSYLLTPANAALSFGAAPGGFAAQSPSFQFTAKSGNYDAGNFTLAFQSMRSIGQLQPGFYDHILRYPFHNTAFGGLSLDNNSSGCNTLIGWMVLDKVSYVNGRLSGARGRFEQYCDGAAQPARGEFNWEG